MAKYQLSLNPYRGASDNWECSPSRSQSPIDSSDTWPLFIKQS